MLTGALRTAIAELAGGHVTTIVDRAVADAAAARRAGTVAAVGRTRSAIEVLALDDLTLLVRALGHELHLANLAEQVHRLRRRRQRDDGTPLPESVADAVARLREGGVADTEIVRAARDDVHLELVLTAHPTEAARRTFLQSQLHLAELLHELDAPYLSATRRSDIASAIAEEATILWLSDDVRSIRPTVDDEIRQGLWFFEKSLLRRRGRAGRGVAPEPAGHAAAAGVPHVDRRRPGRQPQRRAGRRRPGAGPVAEPAGRALSATRCASCPARSACRSRWPACRTRWQRRSRPTSASCRGCTPTSASATRPSRTGAS